MSWLPKKDKLDPVQASAIDFAVAQEGNFYIKGVRAKVWEWMVRLALMPS